MAISIDGVDYEAKSITLPQLRACRKADPDEADVLAIAFSTGASPDAVRAWMNTVAAGTAATAIAAVFDASGLSEGAQKSS